MTSFKLVKKSATRALVNFHILNSVGHVVGSVNVPPSQEADLLAHWKGPSAAAKPGGPSAIAAALLKGPRLSRQAILRGG